MVDIILNHLASKNQFWVNTVYQAGKATINPYMKLLCALTMICYGVSGHAFLDTTNSEKLPVAGVFITSSGN